MPRFSLSHCWLMFTWITWYGQFLAAFSIEKCSVFPLQWIFNTYLMGNCLETMYIIQFLHNFQYIHSFLYKYRCYFIQWVVICYCYYLFWFSSFPFKEASVLFWNHHHHYYLLNFSYNQMLLAYFVCPSLPAWTLTKCSGPHSNLWYATDTYLSQSDLTCLGREEKERRRGRGVCKKLW